MNERGMRVCGCELEGGGYESMCLWKRLVVSLVGDEGAVGKEGEQLHAEDGEDEDDEDEDGAHVGERGQREQDGGDEVLKPLGVLNEAEGAERAQRRPRAQQQGRQRHEMVGDRVEHARLLDDRERTMVRWQSEGGNQLAIGRQSGGYSVAISPAQLPRGRPA